MASATAQSVERGGKTASVLLLSPQPDDLDDVRSVLASAGYRCDWINLADSVESA